jgi:predicted adenylyl cyclase CyaB
VARNIELKARIPSVEALLPRARALADGEPELIVQDDRFYACAHGRLKLRCFEDGSGELIAYRRPDSAGPKLSDYLRVPTADTQALHEALARSLGEVARLRKRRWLLRVGATRIHLDRVEGLGDFLELEVVLRDHESVDAGSATAQALRSALGVPAEACIAGAYADLLAAQRG